MKKKNNFNRIFVQRVAIIFKRILAVAPDVLVSASSSCHASRIQMFPSWQSNHAVQVSFPFLPKDVFS
jgi:hypothetical protein